MRLAALFLLLATTAWGQTTLRAPWGGAGACPFPGCRGSTDIVDVSLPPFSAVRNGVTDDTLVIERALATGLPVFLPAGMYAVCNLDFPLTGNLLMGAGPGVTILVNTAACTGGSNMLFLGSASSFISDVEIKDLTIRSTVASVALGINGRNVRNLSLQNVDFDVQFGTGIVAQGVDGFFVRDVHFYGRCTGTAMTLQRGMRHVEIGPVSLEYLNSGITLDGGTASSDPMRDIQIHDAWMEQLWWMQPTVFTGSGGTVTYTDGGGSVTLTDSAANFTGLALQDVVRVLPVRATGTVTSEASGTRLDDTGATFVASGVQVNDLVRTSTAWARVIKTPTSATQLYVTGWRDRTTYRPVEPPPAGTAYTIYRVLVGHRTSNTATQIVMGTTFPGLMDMLGVDITGAPPVPNGTLYEVSTANPDYHVFIDGGVDDGRITNSTAVGLWSDQIGVFGDNWVLSGLTVNEGQDGGITLTGNRNTVTSSEVNRNGFVGIYLIGAGNVVTGNVLHDNTWVNGVTATLGDIQCRSTGTIVGNDIERTNAGQPLSIFGIVVTSTATGCRMTGNRMAGHATREIDIIAGATLTQCDGVPCGTVAANACATTNPGIRYFDTNLMLPCFCNGQGTPRYCRDDTGACGASTTDCG